MKRTAILLVALAIQGCGVSKAQYDAKAQEAETAKQEAEAAKAKAAQLQQQLAESDQQKNADAGAPSQPTADDQKAALEEAKRALQEAQERSKLLEDLQTKFKRMIDAGHLKVTTRHGRVVLQLHNDVLFDVGAAEVKPAGKQAVAEVAATLHALATKRFQVAGHTDAEPITTETKKTFPTNWELSSARAIAVVKLLVAGGVDPGHLSAAGYGPYDPVASNATPDGQAKNRRIEITLVPYVATELIAAH